MRRVKATVKVISHNPRVCKLSQYIPQYKFLSSDGMVYTWYSHAKKLVNLTIGEEYNVVMTPALSVNKNGELEVFHVNFT